MTEGTAEAQSLKQKLSMWISRGQRPEVQKEPTPAESFSNFLNRLKSSNDELAKRFEESLRERIKKFQAEGWPRDVSEIDVSSHGWNVGDLKRDRVKYYETMDRKEVFEIIGEKQGLLEKRFSKSERYKDDGFAFAVKSGWGGVDNGYGKAETWVASLRNPNETKSGVYVYAKISRPGQTGDVYGHDGALLGLKITVPVETAKAWSTNSFKSFAK